MDIRTRIKKMISGEIDIDEYEKEYTNKVRKEQEEKISKSVKENNSNISVNLPTQNISLPTASSRNNLKIPSYRQTSSNTTLSLPKVKLDTSVDFNDLELVTRKDLEARQEAERINKDIERGDYTSSIAHVLNSFPEGIKSGVTGIANAGMIPLAGILQRYSDVGQKIGILKDNNIFDNAYNSILDASDYLTDNSSYRSKVGANINNEIVKTIGDVSYNVGQMIPSIAANAVAPGTGLVVTGLSAGGNSAQETINNDRSNLLQATLTGTAKGFVEAGTEKLTGGNIISKTGSLDNVVNKTISSKIKSNIGKEIANRGYQFVGEMAEEQISNNAGYVIDKLINNKDLPDAEQWWNDFSETNKVTFLTTLALSMVGLGGGSFSDNVDTTQYTSQELQEADKWFNEAKKIIEQENRTQNNNIERTNGLPTVRNNQRLDANTLPVQNEQYRYNTRNYEESAKRYGIDTNNETVKSINRVAQDRGINVIYNADLFNDTNTNAIWRNNADGTREIILNPNADTNKTLQNVITHELTHDLEGTTEYNELRDLILNYNENKTDYAEARKSLEELYSKVYDRNSTEFETLVDNEVVADILGNKLGNQEFINNLTTEKPTLGKRIYNWVVDKLNKLNKLTGYKSEKIFWTDIKNKFENAYKKENTNNDNKNLYSIAGEKGMQNLVKSNPSNNITLEQLYNRAKQLQRNGLSNEEIRQQTNWFQDKNGDWKFEFSDKDMTLKNNIKLEAGKKYRLGDILEHDTLFTAYPELADYNVKIGAISKANASFNENTKTITLNKEVMQNKKMIEGTLIHEIQHAIQHIENFESGSSSRKSKLTYYNSLGEIEAADTKDRFLNEKYNNKEVTNIAPESSKQNPRHKNLNSYLQKRGIIDKIKDNIYNPSKGSGINHEINQENIPTNKRRNSALVDGRKLERYVENENSNKSSFSMEESENNSSNTELSEEAKRQLHRYVGLDEESLNKAFSEVIDNKENMLQELNSIRKKYKEFQNTDKFKNALEEFSKNDSVSQEVQDIMDKASKYADKIRYYQNAYNTYHAQQEAINSILMGNETNTRSDQDIVKEAEKHFGVTTNFKETAYIDTNGKQIDFSGKHEGGPSGERTLDHRQINEIDIDMESFINMGNIRILPEGGGINLKIEPNSKQYSKLREYIDSVDGEIYIDIDKTNNSYDNAEYVKGTPSNKIINDLKYYFKNGEFPKQSELAKFRYSITKKNTWQSYLDKNYKSTGTGQTIQEVKKAPTANNNTLETGEYTENQKRKLLNPTEISNLKQQDANTTPKLKSKNYERGNKKSNFFSNITEKSKFLNEDFRSVMKQDENIEYYKTVSNKETLEKAYNKLQEDGEAEVVKWHSKDSEKATTEDVAEGWILLKQYQDSGDYESAVEVAKKMREIGTKAGQTVQAYNILSRLTPEGMFYYAQSELSEAYSKMVEGKSKKWIDENKSKFDLTPEETKFIMDTMQEVSTMPDGYNKKVKLAEIQKVITDKIPSTAGQSIKAWMRISMLFNPKTQVRNVMGNAVIMPVNMFSDSVSSGIDKLISKKTGIRTTGNTSIKNYAKGFGKGLYESYNDFKKGINTRNIEGNRFEVSEGRSFNNKGLGKALNRVDNLLSFMLDAGDRGFYEATFTNSINNQLVLNNTTEVTQEMIDIATTEALQRTWQDNNNYTKAVLKIRNILNSANIKGYGLGDVLIPFAKTPANLTKAIIDYSPAGLVNTITSGIKLKNSLENGQYTPQLQHQFVQNLGKTTAGTFLYVLGYALASAGIATGEADEDKDVKNFMKNSLGINSYSIKIGDKSFTYDWAQPIATPLAIMTNFVKYSKENPEASTLDKAINAMNIGTEQLLAQSFMDSLNTVLNGNGTTLENLSQAVLELPSRAIPTFGKQIADMVDSTQRTSFEYDKPIQSAINSVIAKIPGASKQLPASVDTLGNEIQKYGGENNLFNVFLNPANMNKGQLSKAGEEIYNVYKETGDTTIFPRTAPYYINNKGEKITMTSEERSDFQKISGTYVEDTLEGMLKNDYYKKLNNEEKAELINQIVSDSYSKAKYDVLKIDSKEYEKLRETLKNVKTTTYYDYKTKTKDMKSNKEKIGVLVDSNYSNKETTALYENYTLSDNDIEYPIIKATFTNDGLNINKYLEYKTQEFTSDKEDDGTLNGKVVSGSKKEKIEKYLDSMGITYMQQLLLYAMNGYSTTTTQKTTLANYIKNLKGIADKQRLEILDRIGFTVYKDGTIEW